MEGPAFSTRTESKLYRSWGGSGIGMTNLTEAKLAREAEICYATLALATDYDCWRTAEADVDIQSILRSMAENVSNAKAVVADAIRNVMQLECGTCESASRFAVVTQKDSIPQGTLKALDIIIGKYMRQS